MIPFTVTPANDWHRPRLGRGQVCKHENAKRANRLDFDRDRAIPGQNNSLRRTEVPE